MVVIQFKSLLTKGEWQWVNERAHCILCGDTCGIVATNEIGEILAVAVFDSFTPVAANVHMAIENPVVLRRGFLQAIGEYLFNVRSRARIYGLVPSNNHKALKLNRHIGMSVVATIPNALGQDIDYVVMGMEKSSCRWISQECREAA